MDSGSPPPRVSVVIPTYNRLPILRRCLEALEHQQMGRSVEHPSVRQPLRHVHVVLWSERQHAERTLDAPRTGVYEGQLVAVGIGVRQAVTIRDGKTRRHGILAGFGDGGVPASGCEPRCNCRRSWISTR